MQQMEDVVISIFLDNLLEGVETFGLGISNDIDAVDFQFGNFPSTIINILDRRMLYCVLSDLET